MSTELLELTRAIALEAGQLAAQRRREGVEVAATKSSIVDVVTARRILFAHRPLPSRG